MLWVSDPNGVDRAVRDKERVILPLRHSTIHYITISSVRHFTIRYFATSPLRYKN
ncbi:MAG: hypothetical protein ABDI19_02665 [Armatimonadota bacterium]